LSPNGTRCPLTRRIRTSRRSSSWFFSTTVDNCFILKKDLKNNIRERIVY
jgi:hypothetical protein